MTAVSVWGTYTGVDYQVLEKLTFSFFFRPQLPSLFLFFISSCVVSLSFSFLFVVPTPHPPSYCSSLPVFQQSPSCIPAAEHGEQGMVLAGRQRTLNIEDGAIAAVFHLFFFYPSLSSCCPLLVFSSLTFFLSVGITYISCFSWIGTVDNTARLPGDDMLVAVI